MNFKNIVNFLLIVLLVVTPVLLAVIDKTAAASLSLISLSFALVFWNIDKFSEFKGAGFEAKLNTAVNDTYAAIDEVKKLAISISSPVASLMAVKSSFEYLSLEYKLKYAKEIESSLLELEIDNNKIEKALSALYNRVSDDHTRMALWALNEKLDASGKIFEQLDDVDLELWTAQKIKNKAVELGVDVSNEIKALEHFNKTKTLLNPSDWQG